MTTFEQGFETAERTATATVKAAAALTSQAKQMLKATREGDISGMRKAAERLTSAIDAARQEVANSKSAWPFSYDEEEAYLRGPYLRELLDAAEEHGLKMFERDDRLVAFPSVLRILPSERAVRVDRKKVVAIRPSKLAETLKANQTKKPRFSSERFLDALYRAYSMLAGKDGIGTTVALSRVYEALTLAPGASAEYSRNDFGRDLFLLDRGGLTTHARSGARFALPASTGTRSSQVFSFVGPEGETVNYYGIRFDEAGQ